MAEEYVALGYNLQLTGELNLDQNVPFVLRPPGYPFFIASILKASGGLSTPTELFLNPRPTTQPIHSAKTAIYLAQAILASLSAVFLFLWISRYTTTENAIILALLFSANPYLIILTGLLHYDTLHLFFVVISGYTLALSLENDHFRPPRLLWAGVLWGLSTLIRPQTLILPVFAFIIVSLKFRSHLTLAIKATIIFTFGMTLVITPYSIRNYALTNRLIPVNAQTGVAMWTATSKQSKPSSNHYNWWDLWYADGVRICKKVTGAQQCPPWHYMTYNIDLEDEFRKEALHNFSASPGVFFKNFVHNFVSFNLGINSVFIKIFQAIQVPNKEINIKKWLEPGNPQTFYSSAATVTFEFFMYTLTLFSFLGIAIAIWKRDRNLLVPGLLYCCFCIAHSITFMDLMYYYVKVPFLYIFTGFLINQLNPSFVRFPFWNKHLSMASIVNGLLIAYLVALNIAVL